MSIDVKVFRRREVREAHYGPGERPVRVEDDLSAAPSVELPDGVSSGVEAEIRPVVVDFAEVDGFIVHIPVAVGAGGDDGRVGRVHAAVHGKSGTAALEIEAACAGFLNYDAPVEAKPRLGAAAVAVEHQSLVDVGTTGAGDAYRSGDGGVDASRVHEYLRIGRSGKSNRGGGASTLAHGPCRIRLISLAELHGRLVEIPRPGVFQVLGKSHGYHRRTRQYDVGDGAVIRLQRGVVGGVRPGEDA